VGRRRRGGAPGKLPAGKAPVGAQLRAGGGDPRRSTPLRTHPLVLPPVCVELAATSHKPKWRFCEVCVKLAASVHCSTSAAGRRATAQRAWAPSGQCRPQGRREPVAHLQNCPGGSMAAPGRPGCPCTAGLLLLLALSMAGRTRPFSAYLNTGVVLVSIRFPGQVASLRN
jgi:hypothetical protein